MEALRAAASHEPLSPREVQTVSWFPARVKEVRAYVATGAAADDNAGYPYHWTDDHVAGPLSEYPEFRESRRSFGVNVLEQLIVEVESTTGHVGVGISKGGDIGAWIVENHLARLVEGFEVDDIESAWDRMFRATIFYGRRGVVIHAISAVELALQDLVGRIRDTPVYALLGDGRRNHLDLYATGPRPDLAQEFGFLAAKMPLRFGHGHGADGEEQNIKELAEMRARVGDGFPLMWDCWMSLEVESAASLASAGKELGLYWLEEPLIPDDLDGHRRLRDLAPDGVLIATGEHEATRWGFQSLLAAGVDVIQPDVSWAGGISESQKIAALADELGVPVIPHALSVYSYHFAVATKNCPFGEFFMMHPTGEEIWPMLAPIILGEPLPENGRVVLPDRPGFGVEINFEHPRRRPFTHPRPG